MASIDLGHDGYKFGLGFVYFDWILTENIMWLLLVRNITVHGKTKPVETS